MMNDTIVKLAILIYDFALLAGTAYLVAVHDWSMWTFLLAAVFFMTTSKSKESK
jgi:hypothetical protein